MDFLFKLLRWHRQIENEIQQILDGRTDEEETTLDGTLVLLEKRKEREEKERCTT